MVCAVSISAVCLVLTSAVYDLPKDILTTLQPRDSSLLSNPSGDTSETSVNSRKSSATSPDGVVGAKVCSLCGTTFETVEDQRSHTRSDFHGYNLKQKLRGLPPVSENDFERLIGGW